MFTNKPNFRRIPNLSCYLFSAGCGILLLNNFFPMDTIFNRYSFSAATCLLITGGIYWALCFRYPKPEFFDKSQIGKEERHILSLFRQLLKYSPEQIYVKDLEGCHVLVSQEVKRIYRQSGKIVGQTSYDIFPKESADEHERHDQEVMNTRRAISKEYQIPDDGKGGIRYFLAIKFPIFDDAGIIKFIGAMTADITQQKAIETELREAKEAADEANEAKSRFLANISHEIRTPLTLVLGMVELLGESPLNLKQTTYLQSIQNAGDVLLGLINNILDLSKIESEGLELEYTSFDLRETLNKIVDVYHVAAQENRLVIRLIIDRHIPSAQWGDSYRLQQILINLVGNAIKFSTDGEITIRVELDLSSPYNNSLQFSVSDQGIGIPSNQLEIIFDVFSQQDSSTTRKYGGSGLGLSICQQLVEKMEGKIWAESKVGEGSTFYFTLRLEEPKPSNRTLNILFVEDDLLVRSLLLELMNDSPHSIHSATNGQEAFDFVKETDIDLIFMDIQMPVMDGYMSTKAIRQWEKSQHKAPIRIIALSANVMKSEVAECIRTGFDLHIGKPTSKAVLVSTINQFL